MHNWSGNYENKNARKKLIEKAVEDLNAPELTVRALKEGRTAAVVPCCQTLGIQMKKKVF